MLSLLGSADATAHASIASYDDGATALDACGQLVWIALLALPLIERMSVSAECVCHGRVGTWIGARAHLRPKDLQLYCRTGKLNPCRRSESGNVSAGTDAATVKRSSLFRPLTEYATALRNLADYNDVAGCGPCGCWSLTCSGCRRGARCPSMLRLCLFSGAASLLGDHGEWRRYKLEQIIKTVIRW